MLHLDVNKFVYKIVYSQQDLPSFTETEHNDGQNDGNDNDDDKRQDQDKDKIISKVPDRRVIHWCNIG